MAMENPPLIVDFPMKISSSGIVHHLSSSCPAIRCLEVFHAFLMQLHHLEVAATSIWRSATQPVHNLALAADVDAMDAMG
jgi:hypothetical protein